MPSKLPEWRRNAWKCRVGFFLFRKVAQAWKDEHTHGEEQHEQAELLVAVLQGEGDGLETGGVSGQLEDSHDSHNSENLSDKSSKSWLVLLLQKFWWLLGCSLT